MKKRVSGVLAFLGAIFILIGIMLSVSYKDPHYYTFFSVGMFLVLFQVYPLLSSKVLFNKWKAQQYFLFAFLIIFVSVIVDRLGILLGYWTYPYFSTWYDEVLKYIFEWGVALLYFMLALLIGVEIFKNCSDKLWIQYTLSLLVFGTAIGLITEYVNIFSSSWKVLSMPITNYKIGEFFVIFQTVGYWLLALIPLKIYQFIDSSAAKN